ncbi:MAG TPA: AbrB/MazE/SpoVT family DNA-binding domain-containing protein [Bryobacteraceae bacterium]|nr:AbrB/MazE/SpoVT family DNA-binding domain-containing protein [Bryobacteraceae bacterium]
MTTEIIQIGNSRGIRIPKPILEQCGFGKTVEIHVEGDRLVLSPKRTPRHGWAEAFSNAGDSVNDELLLDIAKNEFDESEWTW